MRKKLKPRKCGKCGEQFQPKTKWQEYCNRKCQMAAYNQKTAALIRKAVAAGL